MTANNTINKQCLRCKTETKHQQDREGENLFCGQCGLRSANLSGVSSRTRDIDQDEEEYDFFSGGNHNDDDNDFCSGFGGGKNNRGSIRIVATSRMNRNDAKFLQQMTLKIENDTKLLLEREKKEEEDEKKKEPEKLRKQNFKKSDPHHPKAKHETIPQWFKRKVLVKDASKRTSAAKT